MRRWLFAVLLCIALPVQGQIIRPPVPYNVDIASPLMNRLQAWWLVFPHLRGGTDWYDIMGRYTGTLTNGAEIQVAKPGWWGRVALDGSNDYVSIGNIAAFDFADTTFTVVVETEEVTDTTATAYLIAKRDPTAGIHGGYFIRVAATTGAITARISDNASNSAGQRSTVALNLYDGLRHHIAVVFTTDTVTLANNDMSIYVDGVLDQGSRTDSSAGAYAACPCPLVFGAESDFVAPLHGYMNNVRFYARGLSALEIAQLAYQSKQSDPATAFVADDNFFAPTVVLMRPSHVYQ